jgi:hypothetical protein
MRHATNKEKEMKPMNLKKDASIDAYKAYIPFDNVEPSELENTVIDGKVYVPFCGTRIPAGHPRLPSGYYCEYRRADSASVRAMGRL